MRNTSECLKSLDSLEKRKHPRIRLPLLVELQHPAIGRRDCLARDISEGGVFVQLESSAIRKGAKVKLTLQNPNTIDAQPTPTVQMEVVRIEPDGLGLAFVNRTSRHLWESVQRFRDELAVGRDYFQLHVSALVIQETGRLLVVQQNGKWTFPGTYLVVGDAWRDSLRSMLESRFALLADTEAMTMLNLETESDEKIPEAAVAKAFAVMRVDASRFRFEPGERYRTSRWLQNPRMIDELTFADEVTRVQAVNAFRWHARQDD